MKKITLFTVIIILALLGPIITCVHADKPKVVASIKPIHALVAGVMQGVTEPELLINGGGSPHGYVLRPSEARALSKADLVVWVGHSLETFMEKPLSTLARQARTLELLDALASDLLPIREVGSFTSHDSGHHHHDDTEFNPHMWLSPRIAKKIVTEIARELTNLDPQHKEQYLENAERLSQKLTALGQKLAEELAPVKDVPYIVFHDAYPYFENSYGLNTVGALSIDPERKPGARRILEIRETIKSSGAKCVFSEPQFEPRLIATITEGTNVRTGVLDPLGADLPAGEDSYFQLLNNLSRNLRQGLL